MTEKRIVEISGVKIEVDTRNAKKIESYKVGDNVKVLEKGYGETYKVYPGVIVGFDEFPDLPTIIVAVLVEEYGEADIRFKYFNKNTTSIQIAPMHDFELKLSKADMLSKMNRKIEEKLRELKELEARRDFFLKNFNKYFGEAGNGGK